MRVPLPCHPGTHPCIYIYTCIYMSIYMYRVVCETSGDRRCSLPHRRIPGISSNASYTHTIDYF